MAADTRPNLGQIVPWAISVVAILVSIAISQIAYFRGGIAPKSLQFRNGIAQQPLSVLRSLGNKASVQIDIDGARIDNLWIVDSEITNLSAAPILTSDIHEPLTISVPEPWRIVTVESDPGWGAPVTLTWHRVDDRRFRSDPALMNPGDRARVNVYLTDSSSPSEKAAAATFRAPVTWDARIAGLDRVREESWSSGTGELRGVVIFMGGPAVPTWIAIALTAFSVQLTLLRVSAIVPWITLRTGILISALGLLSVAAAESLTDILFDGLFDRSNTINGMLVAVQLVTFVGLGWAAWRRVGQRAGATHGGPPTSARSH